MQTGAAQQDSPLSNTTFRFIYKKTQCATSQHMTCVAGYCIRPACICSLEMQYAWPCDSVACSTCAWWPTVGHSVVSHSNASSRRRALHCTLAMLCRESTADGVALATCLFETHAYGRVDINSGVDHRVCLQTSDLRGKSSLGSACNFCCCCCCSC
jgi:hypothetical protein